MKSILYLGNKLSIHGFPPTTIETLGPRFEKDFKVYSASSFKSKLPRLLQMWWMIFKHRKVDYVLIDTYSSSAFLFAWTSARFSELLGMKYIPILHGGNLPNRLKQSQSIMNRLIKKSYAVICPSGYLKSIFEAELPGNYYLIPNFIELNNYPFFKEKTAPKDNINLLWVRSFHEIYNPTLGVQVLKSLWDQGYTTANLCMVGPDKDGSLEAVKSLAAQLEVSEGLKTTGRLTKKEWIDLSKSYNIFINTTNIDNTPVSVMEALALGFPVVTTNVGGIPYLFQDKKEGIMVPPDDIGAMTEAIILLARDANLYKNIRENARQKAIEWDWDRVKQEWLKVLT